MTNDLKIPFTAEELLKDLPAERSLSEMPERYRTLFQECLQEYRDSRKSIVKGLADLTISLTRNLKEGFQNVAVWVDSLIPDFELTPVPNYACVTRAVGGVTSDEALKRLSFEKFGDGCSMSIDVEIMPIGANLTIRLLDDNGKAILPFSLTASDVESGKVLLQNREFRAGAAKINGVERGKYELIAFSTQLRCAFILSVE